MSPSPEKIEGQKPAETPSPGSSEKPLTRGLQVEARLTAPTWEIGLSAVVHDFTPGEVILLLDDQIAAGTRVTVQLNTSSFVGDILFCSPNGTRYEAHVSFDDVDATGLRRTPRFPVSIPARIFSSSSEEPLDGKIVDVSGEGLGVELAAAIPMQTNIAVQSEENTALGVVRHCRELSPGRFRAGIQLHHIIKKDPDLEKASADSGWMNKLGARLGRKKAERPKGWS
ncbi:MAG: PilZ domain-containing protein [Bryobacteraceae bacterium]|jgi:hypothetical protein